MIFRGTLLTSLTSNPTIFFKIAKTKPLSAEKRQSIVQLLKDGFSTRQIAIRVGVGQKTVSRVKNQENIDQGNIKPGRKSIINDRLARAVSRKVLSGEL